MKKFIRFFVFAFAFTLATISLVSCGETNEKVAAEAIKLLLVEQEPVVEKDFTVGGLVSYKGTSYQVTWASNNECLAVGERVSNKDENGVEIAAHYVVKATRPETGSVDVTLTATVNAGEDDVATKDFTYTLYAIDVFDIAASYTFSKANKVAKEAFDLPAEHTFSGKKATITWTVDNEAVTIADGKASFDVKEEVTVVFTAEFTYGGVTAKFPYTVTLAPTENGPVVITTIADGQSYYMGVNQENLGKYLYFAGKSANKEYYMETTETVTESTKVTVNAIEGGYVLSFVDAAGATKYLDIIANGTYVNLYIVDTKPTTPLVWDEDYNTFTKDVNDTKYYMGTYSTYNTLSASKYSYISTSFPIHFYDLPLGPVSEFTAGTSYKWALNQESLGKTLYFAGTTANKDYYMSTTENASEAVDVTPVQVEGGYHLKFVNPEGATKYLDIVGGNYVNLYIVDTPTGVFVWNAEHSTFTKDIDGTHYYIGTYNTYNTLSASKLSYISTSYPCHLYASGGSLSEITPEETPEVTPEETPEVTLPTEPTTTITVTEALAAAVDTVIKVEGEVKAIKSVENGSIDITDGTSSITIYGLFNKDGVAYASWEEANLLAVGDTVVLYGTRAVYSPSESYSVQQIQNAVVSSVEKAPEKPVITGPVGTLAATISFAEVENRTTLTEEQQVWVQNSITVTNNKASSSTKVADYSNPVRFYASSTVTIEYTSAVKSIVIKTNSKHFSDTFALSDASVLVDAENNTCTIVLLEAANSYTFSLPAQIRVDEIRVYTE